MAGCQPGRVSGGSSHLGQHHLSRVRLRGNRAGRGPGLLPGGGYTIDGLRIDRALFLKPGQTTTTQITFDEVEKRFAVHSRTNERATWELHAWGRLQKLTLPPAKTLDIATWQAELEPGVDHEGYYQYLADLDYHYGPDFRLVQSSWRTDGKSLVRIVATEEIAAQAAGYHMHPALLDACIHALAAAYSDMHDASEGELYLPVGVERVHLWVDHLPATLWVTVTSRDDDHDFADLEVYDDQGRQVAALLGFEVEQVEQIDAVERELESAFYQFRWQQKHLKGAGVDLPTNFASPTAIHAAVTAVLPTIYAECDMALLYEVLSPNADRLTWQIIQNAFIDLGWTPAVGERFTLSAFLGELGIVEDHTRLVRADLTALEKAGILQRIDQDAWQVIAAPQRIELLAELAAFAAAHPRFAADIALIQATGASLADVFSGKKDAVEVLFPGGSADLLTAFYRNGGDGAATQRLMERVMTTATADLPQRRPLRVLEVGAGTGALTSMLLPYLPADRTEYTFTDISPKFLGDAQRQFGDYSWIDYRTFDLEQPLAEQGIEAHGYDLVVASNVLHATADLHKTLATVAQCLAADGLLLFHELTDHNITYDNIFGLFDEWWSDTELRPERALMDRAAWVTLLRDCGYRDVQSFGHSPHPDQQKQSIFIAQAPRMADTAAPTAPSLAGDCYLLFADRHGTSHALQHELTVRGARAITVMAGDRFQREEDDRFTVDPASKEDLNTLLAALAADHRLPTTVVHAWSLDHPAVASLTADLLAPDAWWRRRRRASSMRSPWCRRWPFTVGRAGARHLPDAATAST
ncbi:MAG: polyketide synthase dehydratase domain-containing protein [Caldilineaceae bacterium]